MQNKFLRLCLLILCIAASIQNIHGNLDDHQCDKRYIDGDPQRLVCVCSSEYCDTIAPITPASLSDGNAGIYTSNIDKSRFSYSSLAPGFDKTFEDSDELEEKEQYVTLTVDPSSEKQTIFGFGGAFTDAAGINIASLPLAAQNKLLRSYFSIDGISYTVGRIPIASCDFSTHEYSYDDTKGDFSLSKFQLAPEDILYKIPYLLAAQQLSNNTMRYFGSPWSAPGWMKTSGTMNNNGTLIGSAGGPYHVTWANYFIKFLEAYSDHYVDLWGLTVQNEPLTGFVPNWPFQTMGYTGKTEADFVKIDLGPVLKSSRFSNLKLMVYDHNRDRLESFVNQAFSDVAAEKYFDGVAVHWYADEGVGPEVLDVIHEKYPQKFILATEACAGWKGAHQGVVLGDWSRAERIARDVMDNLNHWSTGWVDWNIALDLEGGPNWVNNFVDSPIVVNATAGEFYKQPHFYALGHFSKFLIPGTKRVHNTITGKFTFAPQGHGLLGPTFAMATFVRPDQIRVAVILNSLDEARSVKIVEEGESKSYKINIAGHSLKTVMWNPVQ